MRTDRLFEKYYYSQPAFVGGTPQFHLLCRTQIEDGARILEVGAGPGNATSEYLASIGPVTGLDVSEEVHANLSLVSAHVFSGRDFPFENQSFDACVSNYLLEHVAVPEWHFAEVARVLNGNGVYCFRTPNLWHYITLASSILPHKAHVALANRLRTLKGAHDPYPTFYRANTARVLKKLAQSAGLSVVSLSGIETEPYYGRSCAALFYPMMLYERIVNGADSLESFRANVFGVMRKPA